MQEAQLDWRAREPPGTVPRALSPRGSAGCSVPLCTEGVRTGGRIPAWAGLAGSHLQELPEGRRGLRVDHRSLSFLCSKSRKRLQRGLGSQFQRISSG